MAKVSVIMGIYNCADTLQEAVDSVLNQTFTDFEIIMCDDGSTDSTYQKALELSQKHSNITLLKNEKNMGLNHTLNRCLAAAKGEYIARMDGDDISLKTRFESQVEFLDKNPDYAFVGTPMYYFDEEGIFGCGEGDREPQKSDFIHGSQFSHATVMVRKSAYTAVEGYSEDQKFLRVEDWHLWIKMYSRGLKGYILSKPLYKMRDDRNAIRRRKFRFRINEAKLIVLAVNKLELSPIKKVYALRPIILGLVPTFIYKKLHKNRLSKNITAPEDDVVCAQTVTTKEN